MTILVQQQLRELCDKATQGDWWIDSHGHRLMSMDRIQTIFIADNKAMGPAVRNPETGNLSHWPNDWDASYIVAVQPKVVRGLLDEIDRLNALVIERETVRIGQSLQRHDDQKQIDELVALGIQQDKDEIERLKTEIAELRRDAERYRWLRRLDRPHGEMKNPGEIGWPSVCVAPGEAHGLCLDRMDEAIDKAMTKEQP